MKYSKILLLILILDSCQQHKENKKTEAETSVSVQVEKDSFPKSEIISTVRSQKNPSSSYALYLPSQYNDSVRLPALVFFDPHGEGAVPISKYRALAEKHGVVLIGSNDSKNGLSFDETNAIAQSLFEEIKEGFSVNEKQVSFCGFSGGAKVALAAAMKEQGILSVIYCGAGLPSQQLSKLPPALGFAGVRDLNYTEIMQTDDAMDAKNNSHALILWNGKHEWTDSVSFEDAFYWMKFKTIAIKSMKPDQQLAKNFQDKNSRVLSNPLDEWWRLKKMIAFLYDVADISHYIQAHESLIKTKGFIAAIQKQQIEMSTELKLKQDYYDALEKKDVDWWRSEVEKLKKEKGEKEKMSQRLLGYISLMCYSLANNSIKHGNTVMAGKILAVYKIADPENPDQPYLRACFDAQNNNTAGAMINLHEAIRLGLRDKSRLRQEEAFASLHNLPEFNGLLK